MKIVLCAIVFTLYSTFAFAVDWQETEAKPVFKGMAIGFYDRPELGSKKIKSMSSADFPATVWYLETSSNRMHLIRTEKGGDALWVKGTRISLPKIEGVTTIKCDSTVASSPGHTGRGLGNRSQCKGK